MLRRDGFILLLIACPFGFLLLTSGCRPVAEQPGEASIAPAWFEDVTEKVGLDFVHDAGPVGKYPMYQQVGSGAAFFDFDKDGRLDIYLLSNGGPHGRPNQLFRQQPDGTFKNVSAGSGLDFAGYCMAVATGDLNNDGWLDVLVTRFDGISLFLNNGNGTFSDVTREAGLSHPSWGVSAAFVDYDRDGWLDLVVANYVDYDPTWPCTNPQGQRDYCAPRTFKGRVSRLFRNVGRQEKGRVRFTDQTEASGLAKRPGPGLGVTCADFDGDGWPDIFIANDGAANHLWMNQRDGTFTEEAARRGVAVNAMGRAEGNMGIGVGDADGDGLLDLVVTHLTEESLTLWKQGPRGSFRDQSAQAGLMRPEWQGTGFGVVMADFDHDGVPDLGVVNGRVSALPAPPTDALGPFWSRYADRNQLFRGDGKGRFRDISRSNPALCGSWNVARGLVRGDFDRDGAQDLLVTSIAGRARLLRNIVPERGHWLQVRAFDPSLNRDAYGAEVTVRAGGRSWVAWLNPSESYACSSEPLIHFGLGTAERIDSLVIKWPDGRQESYPGCAADQRIERRRGTGRVVIKK